MSWELREVSDVECTLDDSGVYVTIHRIVRSETHKEYYGTHILVRADLMTVDNEPIVSFIGTANAVRKHLIRFLMNDETGHYPCISQEHASYIGYELLRAETDPNYVQD